MKKTIYMLAVLAVTLLAACNEKEEVRVYEHSAAQDIVGHYAGSWHCTSTTGTDTIYVGEIDFELWNDTIENVCFVYPRCGDNNKIFDLRGLTNVAHAGDALTFNNDKTANGIGTAFFGRVDDEKNITMSMTLQGREGRKTVMMNYVFSGQKMQVTE